MSISDKYRNEMCYNNAMEYCSPIKRNEGLMYVTTWINFENTVLTEKSQLQKTTYYMIAFIENVQKREIYTEIEGTFVVT